MDKFPCTKCGICCKVLPRHLGTLPLKKDGSCKYLEGDNFCTIYSHRPPICDHVRIAAAMGLTIDELTKLTAPLCNALMDANGVPPSYHVTLEGT